MSYGLFSHLLYDPSASATQRGHKEDVVERETEEKGEEREEREKEGGREGGKEGVGSRGVGSRRPRITERDAAALRWLVEQRAANTGQVGVLLHQLSGRTVGARRVRQVIARWEQLGLVERRYVWHGQPAVVIPTKTGAQLSGQARWRAPSITTLRHTLGASQVRLVAVPVGSGRLWVAESALRREAPRNEHIPDGGWTEPDGTSVAVEVELTLHGKRRVHQAIRALLAAHRDGVTRWDRVLYLCSPVTLSQVRGCWHELDPHTQQRVMVDTMPDIVGYPATGGAR